MCKTQAKSGHPQLYADIIELLKVSHVGKGNERVYYNLKLKFSTF